MATQQPTSIPDPHDIKLRRLAELQEKYRDKHNELSMLASVANLPTSSLQLLTPPSDIPPVPSQSSLSSTVGSAPGSPVQAGQPTSISPGSKVTLYF